MQKTPLISILIPIYNTDKYLEKCLDSMLHQTLTNIEIICVNDGSTDGSLAILEAYAQKDSRFKVFSQANAGAARARSLALQNARAPYLMFCDSDDWYEPQMCEAMYKAITEQNVDLVMCDCNIVQMDTNHGRSEAELGYNRLYLRGKSNLDPETQKVINALLWNKIFKKELINQYQINFPNNYEHDDDSFIHQYVCVAKSVYGLDEILYNYVIRTHSLMWNIYNQATNVKKQYARLTAIQYTYNFLLKNNLFEANKEFFLECLYWQIKYCYAYVVPESKHTAVDLAYDILKNIDLSDGLALKHTPLFKAVQSKNYKRVDKLLKAKKYNPQKIKFLGIVLYKKKETSTSSKHYILGLRVWKNTRNKKC